MKKIIFLISRKIIYQFLFAVDQVFGRKNYLVVFCYHSLRNDDWRYSVPLNVFKRQIDYLLRFYQPIEARKMKLFFEGRLKIKNPSFLITFDDGYKDIIAAIDFLKEKKISPLVFLLSEKEKVDRKELENNKQLLERREVKKIIKYDWEVGCHSATHSDFLLLDMERLEEEIKGAKVKLKSEFRKKINYFAYPKGKYSLSIINKVKKAGYSLGFSMDSDFITKKTNPWKIPRVGIDATHGFWEFKATFSPSVILFKKTVKTFINI